MAEPAPLWGSEIVTVPHDPVEPTRRPAAWLSCPCKMHGLRCGDCSLMWSLRKPPPIRAVPFGWLSARWALALRRTRFGWWLYDLPWRAGKLVRWIASEALYLVSLFWNAGMGR